jgi:5-methylcytosine-specific restriction endonuclease McrA
MIRDGGRCHWCGGEADQVDHLLPRRYGGGDSLDNLVAAWHCNLAPEEGATPDLEPIL